jgi:signal transduction histidine kinase
MQQVILNLILNAAEAMTAVDRDRVLRITTKIQAPDRALVVVNDSGMGFAPDGVDRLFEAFYTTKSGGMGMGLSICRTIVEAHGGKIWASQNDGVGATFQFLVPLHRSMTP